MKKPLMMAQAMKATPHVFIYDSMTKQGFLAQKSTVQHSTQMTGSQNKRGVLTKNVHTILNKVSNRKTELVMQVQTKPNSRY